MPNHVVTIALVVDPKGGKHARPAPGSLQMAVGDTVAYQVADPGDKFEVVYEGSPFSAQPALVISDSKPVTVKTRGKFFSKCFIIRNGERFGWSTSEDPNFKSGGDQDVKP